MKDPEALIAKYKAGTCTPQELVLIDKWLLKIDEGELSNLTDADFEEARQEVWLNIQRAEAITANLTDDSIIKIKPLWPRITVAAAILFILSFGFYFYNQFHNSNSGFEKSDIAPGQNSATLTLSDGRKIKLSDAADGALARENGVSITKTSKGQIVYSIGKDGLPKDGSVKFNTLSTAKGETYKVMLPDGSSVWLNAASSIKYPASFVALKDRNVELEGEAYFEIYKDKKHPFIVKTRKQQVEVLGTHFNINSYDNEPEIKTTLLEGSVKVWYSSLPGGKGRDEVVIKPGEQVVNTGSGLKVQNVDVDNVIGWKNDDFVFNGESFGAAMRKIARWYNVEIIYDPVATANIEPGGWISRKSNISVVLKRIESTGQVHFTIEGRRITVTQ